MRAIFSHNYIAIIIGTMGQFDQEARGRGGTCRGGLCQLKSSCSLEARRVPTLKIKNYRVFSQNISFQVCMPSNILVELSRYVR